MTLTEWAIRHQVSEPALRELRALMGVEPTFVTPSIPVTTEAGVQSLVRLEAAKKGVTLWRNNVGVLLDARGVPVRYGLANDSAKLNKVVKSADLIGWRPLLITMQHVGSHIAQFVSRECKHPGWKYSGDEHEQAQLRWAQAVIAHGGDASFCSGVGTL